MWLWLTNKFMIDRIIDGINGFAFKDFRKNIYIDEDYIVSKYIKYSKYQKCIKEHSFFIIRVR